jgi:hypothetical protein
MMSDILLDNAMLNIPGSAEELFTRYNRSSNSPKSLWGIVISNLESHLKGSHMFKKIAAAAALTLLASSSFAAPVGGYGAIDVGTTRADSLTTNSSKVSYGALLGYGVNENVAVEVGYRRLGDWNQAGKINQGQVSLVGSVPLKDQFSVFARVGYNKLNGAGENSSGALYGVGLGYQFTPAVFGRVEVQKPANSVNNVGVTVGYKF